ncbi:unnamed protein product [Linum trigynum]|uniref:Uncharacterized protein n=1 Tax=Linum trigynum TaxID=586398 RepID=A0AAV2GNY5_9ROSI
MEPRLSEDSDRGTTAMMSVLRRSAGLRDGEVATRNDRKMKGRRRGDWNERDAGGFYRLGARAVEGEGFTEWAALYSPQAMPNCNQMAADAPFSS